MAFVKKEELPAYVQAEEVVPVAELKGDVIVRSPSLSERLQLALADKKEASSFGHMVRLLEVSVLDGEYNQLMTAKQWQAFGGKHLEAAIRLWDIAWRLADFNGEQAEKNSEAPTSD